MSAYGGERREIWGDGNEHSWYRHECVAPAYKCWVGCGPIHRDDDPTFGDVCNRCGCDYSRVNDSLSICEG